MADPVTMIAVGGMAASAIGGLVSAGGSMYQGQAQSNMFGYQAGVARVNKVLADQDAAYARAAGEVEAQQIGMRGRAQVGATKVGFAAGNIDTSTGSAKQVLGSETELTQYSEALTRANAAKKAYGFEVGGAMDTAQAGAYDVAATTSKTAGDIGAVSSILGAAGNVSSKWMQGQQAGVFGGSNSGPWYVNPNQPFGA